MTDTTCKNNQVKKEKKILLKWSPITIGKKAITDVQDNKTRLSFTVTACNIGEKNICAHAFWWKKGINLKFRIALLSVRQSMNHLNKE